MCHVTEFFFVHFQPEFFLETEGVDRILLREGGAKLGPSHTK